MLCFFASEVAALCGKNYFCSIDDAVQKVLARSTKSMHWNSKIFRRQIEVASAPSPVSLSDKTTLDDKTLYAFERKGCVDISAVTKTVEHIINKKGSCIHPPPSQLSDSTITRMVRTGASTRVQMVDAILTDPQTSRIDRDELCSFVGSLAKLPPLQEQTTGALSDEQIAHIITTASAAGGTASFSEVIAKLQTNIVIGNKTDLMTVVDAHRGKINAKIGQEGEDRAMASQPTAVRKHTQKAFTKTFNHNGRSFKVYGKLDGYNAEENRVVEVKTRKNKAYSRFFDNEVIQVTTYMLITGAQKATLIEKHRFDKAHEYVQTIIRDPVIVTLILDSLAEAVDQVSQQLPKRLLPPTRATKRRPQATCYNNSGGGSCGDSKRQRIERSSG